MNLLRHARIISSKTTTNKMKTTDDTGRKSKPKKAKTDSTSYLNYMVIQARGKAVVQPNFAYILKQHCCGQNEKKVTALPKLSSRFRDFF